MSKKIRVRHVLKNSMPFSIPNPAQPLYIKESAFETQQNTP
jgi:hypothetical protein